MAQKSPKISKKFVFFHFQIKNLQVAKIPCGKRKEKTLVARLVLSCGKKEKPPFMANEIV